jgi:hypothetical protein
MNLEMKPVEITKKSGFEIEIDGLIGLAKANDNIKTYLIDQVLEVFEDDVFEKVESILRDVGWRAPR